MSLLRGLFIAATDQLGVSAGLVSAAALDFPTVKKEVSKAVPKLKPDALYHLSMFVFGNATANVLGKNVGARVGFHAAKKEGRPSNDGDVHRRYCDLVTNLAVEAGRFAGVTPGSPDFAMTFMCMAVKGALAMSKLDDTDLDKIHASAVKLADTYQQCTIRLHHARASHK